MAEGNKGLLESLAAFATTLVSIAHTRLELLSTEFEEDRQRWASLVILYLVAAFFLVIGLVLAIGLLVFVLWENHRLLILFSIAVFFMLSGLALAGLAIRKTRSKPKLFSASLMELRKDKDTLDSRQT